ncbi:MAG: nitrite reductase (NADH) large subunit [Arenicella sp.]
MKSIIIIGAGPTGVRAANELLNKSDTVNIKIFNAEASKPYNRAQLSFFLAGELDRPDLDNSLSVLPPRLIEFDNCRIQSINTQEKLVVDQQGNKHLYDKLILATGSYVNSPRIAGENKSGVCFFRSLEDAEELHRHRGLDRDVYIVGSGPLGIETALAMKTQVNRVYLQVREILFAPELDDEACGVLADYIRSNGITIIDGALAEQILGRDTVTGVRLNNGNEIPVGSVVMCTGVSPCIQLAENTDLEIKNGIVVDDFMLTNCDSVYAIGGCAQHSGVTHGLISACYEQAETCVSHILSKPFPYSGEPGELQFKFRNFSSHVLGNVNHDSVESIVYKNTLRNIYRKLYVVNRSIVGAVVIGDWSELGRVAGAIASKEKLPFFAQSRFIKGGKLWSKDQVALVDQPESYIVCLCKGVTRGEISSCMEAGNRSLACLGKKLEAGVTCGSCQPLLMTMLNEPVDNLIMRHHRAIYWASLVSIALIILTFFAPKLPFERSVQFAFQFEKIWYGSLYKQTTGYILLALVFFSGGITARKRWKRISFGNLDDWRFAHTVTGLVALVALIVHTGFRLGENLNLALMIVFLLATLTGSIVGFFMSRNHHWTDLKLALHRAWWSRVHYGLLWLLPGLLTFHILSSYYFA